MITSSFSPFTNGAMTSDLRTPSRIRISWLVRNSSGWPASEGVFSILELPVSPWQVAHSCSRSCSVCAASGPLTAACENCCGDREPQQPAIAAIEYSPAFAPGYLLAVFPLP